MFVYLMPCFVLELYPVYFPMVLFRNSLRTALVKGIMVLTEHNSVFVPMPGLLQYRKY